MGLIDKVNAEVNGSGDVLSTLQTYATRILKPNIIDGKNVLTQQMVSAKNTKYVIKYDYELEEDITVPENCVLEFDGGSLSGGYTLTGNNTFIKANSPSLNGVTLSGFYANGEIESGIWFDEDIENGLNQLANNFCKLIISDDYTISSSIAIVDNRKLEIDGRNHILTVLDVSSYGCIYAYDYEKTDVVISVKNLIMDFSQMRNTLYEGVDISAIHLSVVEKSYIDNVVIKNFNSRYFSAIKNFYGIQVSGLHKGYTTEISNVRIENINVLGDGIQGTQYGTAVGVYVNYARQECGNAFIHHVSIRNMININTQGEEIYDDVSGIYINASYTSSNTGYFGSLNAVIEDCEFTDVAKRCIKAQTSSVIVNRCNYTKTKNVICGSFFDVFAGVGTISSCRLDWDGRLTSISDGVERLNISDVIINSDFTNNISPLTKAVIYSRANNIEINISNLVINSVGDIGFTDLNMSNKTQINLCNCKIKADTFLYHGSLTGSSVDFNIFDSTIDIKNLDSASFLASMYGERLNLLSDNRLVLYGKSIIIKDSNLSMRGNDGFFIYTGADTVANFDNVTISEANVEITSSNQAVIWVNGNVTAKNIYIKDGVRVEFLRQRGENTCVEIDNVYKDSGSIRLNIDRSSKEFRLLNSRNVVIDMPSGTTGNITVYLLNSTYSWFNPSRKFSRPSTYGIGDMWFDYDIGKPIYKTISGWVYADGTSADI